MDEKIDVGLTNDHKYVIVDKHIYVDKLGNKKDYYDYDFVKRAFGMLSEWCSSCYYGNRLLEK